MTTQSPNTSLLAAKNATASDKTPAQLAQTSSAVSFAFQGVQPPSTLYVDVDDQFVLQAATSSTGEVVTVNVRLLLPNGRLEDMQFTINPINTRAVLRKTFALTQGYILSVSAVASIATTRGQTFLRISTQRAASGVGNPAQMLFSDYVTNQATSAYPNGRVLSPQEGPGFIYTPLISNPGAGLDWVINVPTNARWRVRGWNGAFTASAAVANRQVQFQVLYAGNFVFDGGALTNITASQSCNVTGTPLTPWQSVNPLDIIVPIPPDLVITPTLGNTATLRVTTLNLQGADAWTFIGMLVEEWLDNV